MKISAKALTALLESRDQLNAAVNHIADAARDSSAIPEDVLRGCTAAATLAWDVRGKVSAVREECIAAGLVRNSKRAAKKQAVQA